MPYYHGAGRHYSRGRADIIHRLLVHQFRGLLVVNQIGTEQGVDIEHLQQGVGVDLRAGLCQFIPEEGLTFLLAEILRRRMPLDPLLDLDEQQAVCSRAAARKRIGKDATLVEFRDGLHSGRSGSRSLGEIQGGNLGQHILGYAAGQAAVRYALRTQTLSLALELFLRLEQREIEVRHKIVIDPGRTLAVVIGKLAAPRQEQE